MTQFAFPLVLAFATVGRARSPGVCSGGTVAESAYRRTDNQQPLRGCRMFMQVSIGRVQRDMHRVINGVWVSLAAQSSVVLQTMPPVQRRRKALVPRSMQGRCFRSWFTSQHLTRDTLHVQ
jgi:hypothetical protein